METIKKRTKTNLSTGNLEKNKKFSPTGILSREKKTNLIHWYVEKKTNLAHRLEDAGHGEVGHVQHEVGVADDLDVDVGDGGRCRRGRDGQLFSARHVHDLTQTNTWFVLFFIAVFVVCLVKSEECNQPIANK